MQVKIGKSWYNALEKEFSKEYFTSLVRFLHKEKAEGKLIYPSGANIFRAFELTSVDQVKVVILGQDPYHGEGQATGLSFSVPQGMKLPPSLKNIFIEVESDLNIKLSGSSDLEPWAKQGVLMLNAILTVRAGEAASHSKSGWANFTDAVIKYLSDKHEGIIFLLWGNFARGKKELINTDKHYVLEAAHPSPLARGAFFGCKHFSKTNKILIKKGEQPINWML